MCLVGYFQFSNLIKASNDLVDYINNKRFKLISKAKLESLIKAFICHNHLMMHIDYSVEMVLPPVTLIISPLI